MVVVEKRSRKRGELCLLRLLPPPVAKPEELGFVISLTKTSLCTDQNNALTPFIRLPFGKVMLNIVSSFGEVLIPKLVYLIMGRVVVLYV